MDRGLLVRSRLPPREVALDHDELGRIQRSQDRQQIAGLDIRRDAELPRRKIEPRGVQAGAVQGQRAQVVIATRVQLTGREGRTRGKNAGELAPHELARLGRLGLVADRNLLSGGEQLVDVGVERMRRNAGHRSFLPLGQGQSTHLGRDRGVIEEKLEEIPQTEKQQGVLRQPTANLEVLLHHRGELFGGSGHGRQPASHGDFPGFVSCFYPKRRNRGLCRTQLNFNHGWTQMNTDKNHHIRIDGLITHGYRSPGGVNAEDRIRSRFKARIYSGPIRIRVHSCPSVVKTG